MNANSTELSSSCRVCLKKDAGTLKSLLNTYLDSEWYPDIFLKCTTIKVLDKLEHPPWICEDCDAELIRAYRFRTKCIESDSVLSAVFVKTENVKTEELEIVECLIKEERMSENEGDSSDSEFKEEDDDEDEKDSESDDQDDFQEQKSKKRKYNETTDDQPVTMCKVCNQPIPNPKNKKAYNKHISTHDPGNPTPFECKLCDKKYKTPRQLQNHVRGHVLYAKCNFCDEKFRSAFTRNVHERRVHTLIKPFKCETCENITFLTKTELNQHTQRHHLPKQFSCDVCKKSFAYNKELTHHMKNHSNERNFQCTVCGKNFMDAAGVKTHEKRVHTTEEKFFCEKCSLSFSKKPALFKHNRTVHRFDECVCNVCGKVFPSIENLRSHSVCHEAEYKFSCPVCPTKTFARMYMLRRHVKASHPTIQLPPTVRKIGKKSKVWKERMNLELNQN